MFTLEKPSTENASQENQPSGQPMANQQYPLSILRGILIASVLAIILIFAGSLAYYLSIPQAEESSFTITNNFPSQCSTCQYERSNCGGTVTHYCQRTLKTCLACPN